MAAIRRKWLPLTFAPGRLLAQPHRMPWWSGTVDITDLVVLTPSGTLRQCGD
jgi:hypothetical protein